MQENLTKTHRGPGIDEKPKKIWYVYFISYVYKEDKNYGEGRTEISIDERVSGIKQIDEIEASEIKENGYDEFKVMNFQLLRTEEVDV